MQAVALRETQKQMGGNVVAMPLRRSSTVFEGFYKFRMKIDKRLDRWYVCNELPQEPIIKEWLYFDADAQPVMYFNVESGKLMLI